MVDEIIREVAEAEGVDPEDLEIVLEDHVNTDSIRLLDEHKSDSWMLEFEIPNHTIRVTGQGDIFVDGLQQRSVP